MIEHLTRIATGTLQHINEMDNIVDLAVFIVAACIVLYSVTIAFSVVVYVLNAVYEEMVK